MLYKIGHLIEKERSPNLVGGQMTGEVQDEVVDNVIVKPAGVGVADEHAVVDVGRAADARADVKVDVTFS